MITTKKKVYISSEYDFGYRLQEMISGANLSGIEKITFQRVDNSTNEFVIIIE